jgi:glycosyltransferase involved in cell wall biosynthesis
MTRPLVSILIPVFNAEEWIADTVRSALAQTWPHKEVIVVDDGSTDCTLSVLQRFKLDHVRVVTQQKGGAAAARNTAFSLSRGEYIQWLDADDLLAPDKIALQLGALERCGGPRTLVSSAWAQFSYRWYRARFRPTALWCDMSPVQWLSIKMGMNLYMPNHSWLVSRELSEGAGSWDTTLSVDDDGEYFCRVLLHADHIRFVPEARVYYRVSGSGTVSDIGVSDRKLTDQWRSMQLHMCYLRSLEDTPATRDACLRFLRTWFACFYPQRPDIVTEVQKVATELGGQMQVPRLRWKYAWIGAFFGRKLARHAELLLPRIRWWFVRRLEQILFRVERHKSAASFELKARS